MPTSSNTTSTFTALHPKSNGYFLFFLEDYEPDQNIKFSSNYFKMAFQHMFHLSASGPSWMVFEHLWDYLHPKYSTNGFPQLFQFCSHIAHGHIPPQVTCILGVAHLLAMTKPSNGVCPIAMGETLYRFISHTLSLQFYEAFVTHFSPH